MKSEKANTIESVLIVDDEDHIRHILSRIFRELEIPDIRVASDGLEACRMYGESPTDFIIMDINMPLMNGIEALKAITESDPDALVIMMTSVGTRQAVEASIEYGAIRYIRKDTPLHQIREKLQGILKEFRDDQDDVVDFDEEAM